MFIKFEKVKRNHVLRNNYEWDDIPTLKKTLNINRIESINETFFKKNQYAIITIGDYNYLIEDMNYDVLIETIQKLAHNQNFSKKFKNFIDGDEK